MYISGVGSKSLAPSVNSAWRGGARVSIAKLLITKGAFFDAADNDGWAPLHRATEQKHIAMMDLLIACGADIDRLAEKDGWAPLHIAIETGCVDAVELLIKRGCDINKESASQGEQDDSDDPDPGRYENLKWSPLHVAIIVRDVALL